MTMMAMMIWDAVRNFSYTYERHLQSPLLEELYYIVAVRSLCSYESS